MTTPEVDFVSAVLALRPPRVAIMIANDDRWRDWTASALTTVSSYWGGAGFVLVPYDPKTGVPSERFAPLVRAYDPDHVVTLEVPASDFEAWYPGRVRVGGTKDEAERLEMIARMHDTLTDPAAEAAREVVVSWSSPMRSARYPGHDPDPQRETVTDLKMAGRDDRFARGFAPSPHAGTARLAASAAWRSDAGLYAALRVGVASSEDENRNRPEPPPAAFDWLIRPIGDPPNSIVWDPKGQIQTLSARDLESWFLVDQGLTQVSRWHLRDGGAVVVGDTGEDFALALAYDRIVGRGIWLTPAMLDDDDTFKHYVQPAIWTTITDLEQNALYLAVTSASQTPKYVADAAMRIEAPQFTFQVKGHRRQRIQRRETIQLRDPNVERGHLELAINEYVGDPVLIPVAKHADGTKDALVGLTTPVPSNLIYPVNSGRVPYWYVDVTLVGDASPRARDLPSSNLTIEQGVWRETNLRASKDGISFDPSSMGLVMSGSFLSGRIGRPRLRSLSMIRWVEGMAATAGLGVRLSSAGRQAELIRRRLGTRAELLDLAASGSLPMLHGFVRLDHTPKVRDPERVVLGLDPYLTFDAIDALLPGNTHATVELIDRLAAARLLRRGLILNCAECGRGSFVDADRLGQQFECPQCATLNALVSERWKHGSEPRWFYDLYAVFRDLLAANGDVPLLAAAALKRSGQSYSDAPELEFFQLDSGEAVAEVDVIACVDRELVIVEAKTTGSFPTTKRPAQAAKLLRVARVLRADKLVLATTQADWKQTDLDYIGKQGAKIEPFPVVVEALNGLA
ncbi:MAG: hypothetical protein JWP19_1402 [Rhodoglobus sp.]|nr:hypothetical protein [Rhodoglobus sp.]